MGAICTANKVQDTQLILNLSHKVILNDNVLNKSKLLTITLCPPRKHCETRIRTLQSNLYPSEFQIDLQLTEGGKTFNELSFKISLEQCYKVIADKMETSTQLVDIILIQQPEGTAFQCQKMLFKIIIEKIDCLHSILRHLEHKLIFQFPWKKICKKQKNKIIHQIKTSRLRNTLSMCYQQKEDEFSNSYFQELLEKHRNTEIPADLIEYTNIVADQNFQVQ